MNKTVRAGARSGSVTIPASKSAAHRQLICAALSEAESTVVCDGISKDIQATMDCLTALGARFIKAPEGIRVIPREFAGGVACSSWAGGEKQPASAVGAGGEKQPASAVGAGEEKQLPCGESGSTLRFLLPIAAALSENVTFHMEGKLPERPHKELIEQLSLHGARIYQDGANLHCEGSLSGGLYELPGGVSSQFISGLLFALPLLKESSVIRIVGSIESAAYIAMTEQAVSAAGIRFTKRLQEVSEGGSHFAKTAPEYLIPGGQSYRAKEHITVERDWSNAAFFLCAGAFSEEGILVKGLSADTAQGDREILSVLRKFGAEVTEGEEGILVRKRPLQGSMVDASGIPDLVPVISVLAAGAAGETRIVHAERLRFKESDRLQSTAAMLTSLGGTVSETQDGLIIKGTRTLTGGTVNPVNDHRIAMAAAVAAGICGGEVTIEDAQCVEKSYPAFFTDWENLEVSEWEAHTAKTSG